MRIVVGLVLALCGVVAVASPPRRFGLPALPSLATLTARATRDQEPALPRCFAYAPATHTFVCLGHDAIYNADHVGADDQATNLRIDAIGPGVQARWTIAAIGGRPTTSRRTIEVALGPFGLQPLSAAAVSVSPGRWTDVGGATVFLRVVPHEGDASFENFGDLRLRCPDSREMLVDLRAAGLELGGTTSAVTSPDRRWLALSLVGIDGGEGTLDFTLDTAVIDVVSSCRDHALSMWTSSRGADPL